MSEQETALPDRPPHVQETPLPPFPDAVPNDEAATSTAYSEHRTKLSFFQKLREADVVSSAHEPRMFGMALVWLGIGVLVMGIVYHVHFMIGLRRTRAAMKHGELVHGDSSLPVSVTLVAAVVLLLIGILAIFYMVN
jgi:hypothetical protein